MDPASALPACIRGKPGHPATGPIQYRAKLSKHRDTSRHKDRADGERGSRTPPTQCKKPACETVGRPKQATSQRTEATAKRVGNT
ncbi:expressed unknown protein [Seminavis robusta]|uniref:Uncharacterized protein n=1 Tax=Seminavis robusta TaxID=568900 RepID=A0A9N8HEM6_9STRA|nr:expressed unknown protein [Seminavis robusta]|eukprot:Sro481_g151620.1 n/a (85) ;mRNA; f:40277-40598